MWCCWISPGHNLASTQQSRSARFEYRAARVFLRVFGVGHTPSLKSSLGGAVAGTLQDTEVYAPWTYGIAVLVGQDPGELVEMR